jgi:hypothetical protein
MSGQDLKGDAAIARLRSIAQNGGVVLHGVCPDVAGEWNVIRDLCLSNPEGSFTQATLDRMVDGLVDAYASLCSRFEIDYSLPALSDPVAVQLKIASKFGRADMSVNVVPAAPPAEAIPAPPSPAETPAAGTPAPA